MNTCGTGFAVPFHFLFKFIKHFVQSITMKYSCKKETEGIFLQSLILIANLYPASSHSHSDRIKAAHYHTSPLHLVEHSAAFYHNEPVRAVTYCIVLLAYIWIIFQW